MMVGRASTENAIDFSKHISTDFSRTVNVSGTFLLIRDALGCAQSSNMIRSQFSAINEIDDLNSVKWPIENGFQNSTCVVEDFGLKKRVAFRESIWKEVPDLSRCYANIEVVRGNKVTRADANLNGTCPCDLLEVWCFPKYPSFPCFGLLKFLQGFSIIKIRTRTAVTSNYPLQMADLDHYFWAEKPPHTFVPSIALLADAMIGYSGEQGRRMAWLTVYENIEIEQLDDDIQETEVNLVLLFSTLGLSLALTILFSAASVLSWVQYILKPD